MNPKISVILPVHNCDNFLPAAIDSIRGQTFADFECLICDGTPGSACDYLQNLVREDKRFVLLRDAGASLPQALQSGVEQARAPILARMDADDIALPQRFALQYAAMEKRPDTVLLGCSYRYIDAEGRPGRVKKMPANPPMPETLLWGCPFLHPGVMLRKTAVLAAGGYRAEFTRAEDYDLWFRLLKYGRLENLPDVLMCYRIHGRNASLDHGLENRRKAILAQALYFLGHADLAGYASAEALQRLPDSTRAEIILRMLACHAQTLGDESEDMAGFELLRKNLAAADGKIAQKTLLLWHLHCALRYLPAQKKRALKHIGKALIADWRAFLKEGLAYLRGLVSSS